LVDPNQNLVALEKDKIKGAIRTDFILSAAIIVIPLGTMSPNTFTGPNISASIARGGRHR
jgi:uncharacterized protein